MKLLYTLLIALVPFFATGQITNKALEGAEIYNGRASELDSVARFRGVDFGMHPTDYKQGLSRYIWELGYRRDKLECPEESNIYFYITIDETGKVVDIESPKSDPKSLCIVKLKEAIYKTSGMWSPALRKGKKVKNKFTFML